ncbi:hypothetical protein PCANC_02947 [Puccinia coronata f. sp. avenae]|uniref:HIG1 domain-containing protein n=1 Tax=Puccinia coronata f. sp. avenae TaxID=200324 RepID=A0A2N5T8J0_9BASI|nr:hypothetical protein PCANC_02947 [Puccinia coronata f. sp. avenae]
MATVPSSFSPGASQGTTTTTRSQGKHGPATIQFEQAPDFEGDDDDQPSTWDLFSRKFKEQPLVPLGAGATTIALLGAGRAIQRGESTRFNVWCRYRVIFQGLTLLAALGGSLYYNQERNEAQRMKEEEREKMRVYQRDLRIRSQELANNSPSLTHQLSTPPSSTPREPVSDNHKSLFNNQNSIIRKTLQDRKLADQHKHLDGPSSTPFSDKN